MTPAGLKSYQKTSVQTADRRKIVVLLYEAAIKNLRFAQQNSNGRIPDEAAAKIKKTQEIINVLSASLNYEKGGEIARNLSSLYDFARDFLNEAIIKNDKSKLEPVINVLSTLLEAWREIASQPSPDGVPLQLGE